MPLREMLSKCTFDGAIRRGSERRVQTGALAGAAHEAAGAISVVEAVHARVAEPVAGEHADRSCAQRSQARSVVALGRRDCERSVHCDKYIHILTSAGSRVMTRPRIALFVGAAIWALTSSARRTNSDLKVSAAV
jgi:hypothetical protein